MSAGFKWISAGSKTHRGQECGFTLVEVIISLVIVGVMAAVAGMGIVIFMKGYATTRENVIIAQKAALATERTNRELETVVEIDATSDDTCIRYRPEMVSGGFRKLQYNDGKIELDMTSTVDCDGTESGNTLTDRLESGTFSITYETAAGEASSPPADILDLLAIHMSFSMERQDGLAANAFNLTINPRNTGSMKGPGIRP
jgi:prepilin-type N-terminal cleavage/methylation domain-containing protein